MKSCTKQWTPDELYELLLLYGQLFRTEHDQKTTGWEIARLEDVGASEWAHMTQEDYKKGGICRLLCSKFGIIPREAFSLSINWGNLFEDRVDEYVLFYVNGRCLPTRIQRGRHATERVACSPDQIAVIQLPNGKWVIAILEYKSAFSREITEKITAYYRPQPLIGCEVFPICTHAVFAEAVFRKCSLDQFLYNGDFDDDTHTNKAHTLPIAMGIEIVYLRAGTNTIISSKIRSLLAIFCANICDRAFIDLGIMFLSDIFAYWTHLEFSRSPMLILDSTAGDDIVATNEAIIEYRDRIVDEAQLDSRELVGVLPWKMTKINIHYMKRQHGIIEDAKSSLDQYVAIYDRLKGLSQAEQIQGLVDEFGPEYNAVLDAERRRF